MENRPEKEGKERREMPQLDTGAFRGQVTWLTRVFVVLYRTRTGEILPKLSQIVKLRAKKRERTRGDARQYEGERTSVEQAYSGRLGKAAGSSHGLLQERTEVQGAWMNQEVGKRTQSKGRNGAMKEYRGYRMKVKLADAYLNRKLGEVGSQRSRKKPKKGKKKKELQWWNRYTR
jgi:Plant ATP synthase F0